MVQFIDCHGGTTLIATRNGNVRLATTAELEMRDALGKIRDGLRAGKTGGAAGLSADEVHDIAADAIGER